MEQIKAWYNGLEENEQKIVLFAVVFFSVVLIFFGLIKPINDQVNSLELSVTSKQSMVAKRFTKNYGKSRRRFGC